MGRHRKTKQPTRLVVHAARIAVGGLALAEITGGFPAIPAHAETTSVVPAVYSTVQPVMTRHRHHSHKTHPVRHAKAPVQHAAATPVVQAVPDVQQVAQPVAQLAMYDTTLDDQPLYDHYTVRQGDTLTHIAAAFGISWESLYSFNTDTVGDNPDALLIGQILRLPA